MQPLVSVIIPVYNVEKYLSQCLDSVLNQTLKNIEIICVDDGSTDSSFEILQRYQNNDGRIIILQQQNQYAGVARNNGLKIAKGKYLSFLDSDDFFDLKMLESMYNQAEKDQSDVVICGWYNYNNIHKTTTVVRIDPKYTNKSPFTPKYVADDLFKICKPNPWTKLYRRDLFIENNLQFEDCICCNDLTCICTSLVLAKKISVMPDCFIYYRSNQSSNLTANRSKHFDATLHAIDKLEKNLKNLNLYNIYEKSFIRKVSHSIRYGITNHSTEEKEHRRNLAKSILSPELYKQLYPETKVVPFKSAPNKYF